MADLKNSGNVKSLIVAGCLTQRYKEELMTEMPEIDGIVGTGNFDKITEIIEFVNRKRDQSVCLGILLFSYENVSRRKVDEGLYTAYIKIAEGCDNTCTFCIIPDLRGKFRSHEIGCT